MKMKNYQEDCTVTIKECYSAGYVIWLDADDEMYFTDESGTEKIEKGTKEHRAICQKYAPIFLNDYTQYRQSLRD
jgi:hypothetical protein